MKTPTYYEIMPYVTSGLVSMNEHPENCDILIFNYTQECQFEKKWDDITLQCRGLILNRITDEVLARPFPKFFNYSEHIGDGKSLPSETPVVTEKLDGSLGILYHIDGVPYIATRGSFESDQAKWATDWWRKNVYAKREPGTGDGLTHLFEIIYPENRIVVKYDFAGLVHLDTIDNSTGESVFHQLPYESIRRVNMLSHMTIEWMTNHDADNFEGYVIHYQKSGLRLKIKLDTYVKLHKVMTGLSEIGIWEMLREKGINTRPEELVSDVPDEFFNWLKSVHLKLWTNYANIEEDSIWSFANIEDEAKELESPPDRKWWALRIQKMKYPNVGFSMLDKKDYSEYIFRLIRPSGKKTFTIDL